MGCYLFGVVFETKLVVCVKFLDALFNFLVEVCRQGKLLQLCGDLDVIFIQILTAFLLQFLIVLLQKMADLLTNNLLKLPPDRNPIPQLANRFGIQKLNFLPEPAKIILRNRHKLSILPQFLTNLSLNLLQNKPNMIFLDLLPGDGEAGVEVGGIQHAGVLAEEVAELRSCYWGFEHGFGADC